jgi:hypothetical protein
MCVNFSGNCDQHETAKALGLSITETLLAPADEMIQ